MVIYKNEEKEEKLLLLRYMPAAATTTTMGTERSSPTPPTSTPTPTPPSKAPLHNFTLPGGLKWGSQKFLRCMKVNSNGQMSAIERKSSSSGYVSSQSGTNRGGGGANNNGSRAAMAETYSNKFSMRRGGCGGGSENDDDCASYYSNYENEKKRDFRPPPPLPPEKRLKVEGGNCGGGGEEDGVGIAAVREKVILDLQTAANRMKFAISGKGSFEDDEGEVPPAAAEEGARPWNLRTRRATYRLVSEGGSGSGGGVVAANGGGGGGVKNLKLDVIKPNADALTSPLRVAGETTPRLRSGAAAAAPSGEKKDRLKFSVPLTRKEIEEDFMAMVRHRPPRRPKKRAKYIQKQLDTLFPGLWLTEITADIYKVPETQ